MVGAEAGLVIINAIAFSIVRTWNVNVLNFTQFSR